MSGEVTFCGSVGLIDAIHETLRDHVWTVESQPPPPVRPYIWCLCGWRSDDLDRPSGDAMSALLVHLTNAVHAAAVPPVREWIARHA